MHLSAMIVQIAEHSVKSVDMTSRDISVRNVTQLTVDWTTEL